MNSNVFPTCTLKTDTQTPDPSTADKPVEEDEETAKRRARAERFGIPFVEKSAAQKKGRAAGGAKQNSVSKAASALPAEVWLYNCALLPF